MRKAILFILLSFGTIAKAQIPQPDPDTTAKHFLIVASIKNLQEISAGEQAVQKAGGSCFRANDDQRSRAVRTGIIGIG
jgi:hypothetical protein